MQAPVEQVVQTATMVLRGTYSPREAVTILATLTREAVPAAVALRGDDPTRAAELAEVLRRSARGFRTREEDGTGGEHLGAVLDDLAAVHRALTGR
ncbi:MAG: hypothetical protein U5R31_05410 [Acidimicrobiia bacterium]|nr:hypothetical protein [Acidimicrobiia bacterium]